MAMEDTERPDAEGDALQSLLDAFPTAPLELIASAYVDAHSDEELAAEIIASSLAAVVGLSCSNKPNAAPPSPAQKTPSSRPGSTPWRRPHPLPLQPLTLEEYLPSSQAKRAWAEPLSQRLRKDAVSSEEQISNVALPGPPETSSEVQSSISAVDFPVLEKKLINGKDPAPLHRPLGSHSRSRGRESAGFGLASSARILNRSGKSIKASTGTGSVSQAKQAEQPIIEVQEKSFWPTETETSLLSMLGDDVDVDLEAVRDVLGFFKGDVQKSFKALQQMYPTLSSGFQVDDVSSTLCEESSTFSECFKDVSDAGSNFEAREVGSMHKANDCSTLHAQTTQAYETFEKAILKHDRSSMKWVVDRLCNKYPHADMATLLHVLRAANFDFNHADEMMQELNLQEENLCHKEKKEPYKVAKEILKSLFSKPEEVINICDGDRKKTARPKKESPADVLEVPKWKTVTSAELKMLGDKEEMKGPMENLIEMRKLEKSSENVVSHSQVGEKSYGNWDDYERHHASAKQHWKTMQSYFTAATAAYASSDFRKSEVLTEKGNMYKQLSMEAKERANACLLEIQNQQNEVDFTLDLREQHIPEALQLLRFHLKTLSSIPSCNTFAVLTGCSENPKAGHKKIREEIIGYLEKKGYKWAGIGPYHVQIQLKENLEHSESGHQV